MSELADKLEQLGAEAQKQAQDESRNELQRLYSTGRADAFHEAAKLVREANIIVWEDPEKDERLNPSSSRPEDTGDLDAFFAEAEKLDKQAKPILDKMRKQRAKEAAEWAAFEKRIAGLPPEEQEMMRENAREALALKKHAETDYKETLERLKSLDVRKAQPTTFRPTKDKPK